MWQQKLGHENLMNEVPFIMALHCWNSKWPNSLCGKEAQLSTHPVQHVSPIHTAPYLPKNADPNLRFCETVHTTPHKNAQKWRFTKTPFKVDSHKNGGFLLTQ